VSGPSGNGAADALKSVALTGNIASGKSTVAAHWRERGVPVVSADDLARDAVRPGSSGLDEVVELFGPGVLRVDGSLDRPALRDRIFRDDAARRRLEEILHPRIERMREAWLAARRAEGEPLAVAEVPLLFEAGMEDRFEVVVFVDAPEEERLRRLVEDREIEAAEAERIIAAQMNPAEKRKRADFVLPNDSTPEALRAGADALLERLRDS
jgi:dephospho-CoA kinase